MSVIKGLIELPDFNIDQEAMPKVWLKSLKFEDFKVFEKYELDFTQPDNSEECQQFACFFGPNGCGKTTILDSIQMIFARYDGYDNDRLVAKLGKSVRHVDGEQKGVYGSEDFMVTAVVQLPDTNEEYTIQINKHGFLQDHPDYIKDIVLRCCFYTRFDFELNKFQLERSQWDSFKKLFEAVTGFEIEEEHNVFELSDDPIQAKMYQEYVLSFLIHKPNETISNNECSAGERKIIKSFSTLLNKEYEPSIILVDNVAMHVESGRHLYLINAMKSCFPNSQIFATTHSYQISRNFGDRSQLFDLRLINCSENVKENPWKLYLSDEIKDSIAKLKSMTTRKELAENTISDGERILEFCVEQEQDRDDDVLIEEAEEFLIESIKLYLSDLTTYHKKEVL